MTGKEYYTMDDARQASVLLSVRRLGVDATEESIREFCLADWPEGVEHQRWLDTAEPEQIADWIAAAVRLAREGEEETNMCEEVT